MKPRTLLSAFLLLSMFALTWLVSSGSAGKSQKESPTPIKLGVMSEKQKIHSKLYGNFKADQKISKLLQSESGDIEIHITSPLFGDEPGAVSLNTENELLSKRVCNADVIIIGTVKDKASQLTDNQQFIFTDYEISVDEVIKNGVSSPTQTNDVITVTRPGGTVLIPGKTVHAEDSLFKPLKSDAQYLLFLKYIASTDSYSAMDSYGSFQVRGDKVISLSKLPSKGLVSEFDAYPFVQQLRAEAVNNPCKRNSGGL